MTEFDIQKRLFDVFKSLDDFAQDNGYIGEPFLVKVEEGGFDKYLNVHFPNCPFDYPESRRWFDLTFRNNEPVDASLGEDSQSRFTGILYIDIIVPQDVGELEAETKYRWIAKLFNGISIDVVDIMKVYISTQGNEADHYRLQVAIVWEADIDKE